MSIEKNKEKVKDKQIGWDLYYLRIAKLVGSKTKCLSRTIGAVLTKDNTIIATGYNGPPRGYVHCIDKVSKFRDLRCPRKIAGYKSGEGLQICPAVHAERNCILAAAKMGISTQDSTLYCYCGFPCKDCFIELINAGVTRIVCIQEEKRDFLYDELSKELLLYYSKLGLIRFAVYMQGEVDKI